MVDVAIVGAGMAGLGAARSLALSGHSVLLIEKSPALGGRVATRRVANCILDHGAQNLKPGDSALRHLMLEELPTDELVQIEAPVRLYRSDGQILPPDPEHDSEPRYAYRQGTTTLPKLIMQELIQQKVSVRYETRVYCIEEAPDRVTLRDDTGQEITQGRVAIVSAPAPQTADLLAESALHMLSCSETLDRVRSLRNVEYSSCLSVLLGYAPPAPPPPAYALLAEDRTSSLLWLAFEQTKGFERAPNGEALLIAQLGPLFSKFCMHEEDEMVVGRTLNELRSLFADLYDSPLWWQVKRWKYSQPRGTISFAEANPVEAASRVIVCGDALRPENGRVHQAYASGLEAAEAARQKL